MTGYGLVPRWTAARRHLESAPCPLCGVAVTVEEEERRQHITGCEVSHRIIVDDEFRDLLLPQTDEENRELEASLKRDGCRDAVKVWQETNILLDGHHRYALCQKHGIPYRVEHLSFTCREDALLWMIHFQLARRNLNAYTRAELALKMESLFAAKAKANQATSTGGANPQLLQNSAKAESVHTRAALAKAANTSEDTIARAKIISGAPDAIRRKARSGELSVHRACELTKALAQADDVIRSACLQYEVTDPQLVTLLNTKHDTATVQSVLASGFLQSDDEQETKPLSEASAWDLQGVLRKAEKEHRRTAADAKLAEKHEQIQSAPEGVFSVVYADCPWQYDNTGLYGAAETIYPALSTDELTTLPERIGLRIQNDAVLFLWATNPLLPDALRVICAWGFEYRTNLVWDKEAPTTGLGFYVRGQHELLLIATRGQFRPNYLPASVIRDRKTDHSRKPERVYTLIETMYPRQRYVELFARNASPRDDWQFYGGEA